MVKEQLLLVFKDNPSSNTNQLFCLVSSIACKIIEAAVLISVSVIVSGGDNLKLYGCDKNQKLTNPNSKQRLTTFSTLSKDSMSKANI